MRKRSFQIALAAVSCALATVFMAIGLNIPAAFASGYLFASIALMLPLAKDMRLGGFLAYAATSLLCLLFGGIQQFYKFVPFLAFFGLHPLVNYLEHRHGWNRWLVGAVKTIWFVGVMELSWWLFDRVLAIELPYAWMNTWIWLLIAVGGAVFFIFYDWLMMRCQKLVDFYVSKVDRTGGRRQQPKPQPPRDDADEIFGSTERNDAQNEKQNEKQNDGEKEEKRDNGEGH